MATSFALRVGNKGQRGRLGVYQVELEGETINLTRMPTDEWKQLAFFGPVDREPPLSGDIFTAESADEGF